MKCRRATELTGKDNLPTDEQTIIEKATRDKWETLRPSFQAWAAESGESPSEFDWIVEGQVEFVR